MKLESEVLQSYNKIDEQYVESLLEKEIKKNNKTFVVLDDDPTGVQTVHDVPVYTRKRLFARHLQKRITCSLF